VTLNAQNVVFWREQTHRDVCAIYSVELWMMFCSRPARHQFIK